MARACIFVLYDKYGIVDRCALFYLAALKKLADYLLVVVNGELSEESVVKVDELASEVLYRENSGYDAWAWKAGLEYMGWDTLARFDQVILANDSVFGPLYPLEEAFTEMEKRKVDFWGMTKHASMKHLSVAKTNPYHYLPEHVQSYFIVYEKNLLTSEALQEYWQKLPKISNWDEAIGLHETHFTKYISDKGFAYDAYVDIPQEDQLKENTMYYQALELVRDLRMPFVKCKLFCEDFLDNTADEQAREMLTFLEGKSSYDTDLIWERAIRKFNQYDLFKSLGLTTILPLDNKIERKAAAEEFERVAVIMHLYFEDMLEDSHVVANLIPASVGIFVSTNEDSKAQRIRERFSDLPNLKEIRVVENRGRSESALIVGMRDIVLSHDVVCFWKEKKSAQTNPRTAPESWAKKINENLLGSTCYIENVITTFANTPHLGMLSVTPPNHSIFFRLPGLEWTINYEQTVGLAKKIDLKVPFDIEKPPITAMGGAFWFRTAALRKLFEYDWHYEDFPEEPLADDGTLLHAIERIYPYVAQDAGYYPAYLMNSEWAGLEYTTMYHYHRYLNRALHKVGLGHTGYSEAVIGLNLVLTSLKMLGGSFWIRLMREVRRRVRGRQKTS